MFKTTYLTLGNVYLVFYGRCSYDYAILNNRCKHCKLIKVTKLGYNLLNINTNKCILKHHLYIDKKEVGEINIDDNIDRLPFTFKTNTCLNICEDGEILNKYI